MSRTYLAPGSTGWKAKQKMAELKQTTGQSKEEKQRIAEIRRKHREQQARLTRGEEPEPEPKAEPKPLKAPADMNRNELVAELKAAGQKVHPASKDDTLRSKVEALR